MRISGRRIAQIIGTVVSFSAVSCSAPSGRTTVRQSANPRGDAKTPNTLVWRGDNLAMAKSRVRQGDALLRPAYDALVREATIALTVGPFSVMDKKRTPPSGDKHDYMSLAPYWWPDPSKPDGVPFIRRDGEVNPESRQDTDSPRFAQMTRTVETLILAYYFSDDARFAERAATLIRAWFLDSATRMNPNLRFAQAIPGVTDGRGIGIIDTRDVATVIDAVIILRGTAYWSDADDVGMLDWCRRYAEWLQASEQGKDEADETNNHGTWYDAQLASLALFIGDRELARKIIADVGPKRIATQIVADGKQPEELGRTRPLHYSLFNLEPFNRLASLARHVDVDLWGYRASNGATLREAARFIAPFLGGAVAFPYKEVTPADPEEFLVTLRQAEQAYAGDDSISRGIAQLPARRLLDDRSALLYPTTVRRVSAIRVPLDTLIARTLAVADAKLEKTATSFDPRSGYPRFSNANGAWEFTPVTSWTSGFFPGSLWLMYAITRDTAWRSQAERWTAPIEVNKSRRNTHDLGFIIFDSFGLQHRLTGNAHARDVVIDASRSLVTRFNPTVGAIKSWDTDSVTDGRRGWQYTVIVDNLMNLQMLYWAAKHGGDPSWADVATRHALTSAKAHLRDDGSTAHAALFDPTTGQMLRRVTWQGYADSSVWARGQAWAVYGFTRAYQESGRQELLTAARRAADWFIAHLPADHVPYWDFADPVIPNTVRDASAAAVAASGLYRLGRSLGGEVGAKYRSSADEILSALCADYVSKDARIMSLTVHSTGGKPQGVEIDVGLIYADYYLLDAIVARAGLDLDAGSAGRR